MHVLCSNIVARYTKATARLDFQDRIRAKDAGRLVLEGTLPDNFPFLSINALIFFFVERIGQGKNVREEILKKFKKLGLV